MDRNKRAGISDLIVSTLAGIRSAQYKKNVAKQWDKANRAKWEKVWADEERENLKNGR